MNNDLPTTLYIIGNGFDLYHRLDTRYGSFGLFLKKNDPDIYEYLFKYLHFPKLNKDDKESLKSPIWADFETSLANLDFDEVIDDQSENAADIGSENFSDEDWNTMAINVGQIRNDITTNLFESFREFILSVDYPKQEDNLINIDENSIFLNFNYTNSLELYYSVSQDRILYIHNKADRDDKIVLGHGINSQVFEIEPVKPPEGLSEAELLQWKEYQNDNFNHSIELAKPELMQYFKKSFKPTSEIIRANIGFFEQLKSINRVYVLGHSLADVDTAYFEEIVSSIGNDKTEWFVSYHNPEEIEEKTKKLLNLNLNKEQISLIKIDELIKK